MKPFLRYTGLAALCAMLATLLSGCSFERLPKKVKTSPPGELSEDIPLGGVIIFDDDE